jgi:CheY-like chemotaxis protein
LSSGWALCFTIPGSKPKTVLVIDDDADTVRLYQRLLQAHDYIVRTARSAEELKGQLGESLPDLVLLDVLMPREDGWDMLNYLKRAPATASIPVVICSVLSQPGLALSLGAEEVLRKPIQEEILIKTVERILAQAGSTR